MPKSAQIESAVILCAGRGERLGELGRVRPKAVLDHAGKPLIFWLLDALIENGITQISIVIGHLGKQVVETILSNYSDVRFIEDDQIKGTAHSLSTAFDIVHQESFLFLEGDIYLSPDDIRNLMNEHRENLYSLLYCENFHVAPTHRIVDCRNGVYSIRRGRPEDFSVGRLCGAWIFPKTVFSELNSHEDVAGCLERVFSQCLSPEAVPCGYDYKHFATLDDFKG